MILRVGGFAAILVLAPVMASAGDGTFGIPPSGILLPPPPAPARIAPAKVTTRTAALIPAERAAPEKVIPPRRVQQTYQPAPADGAGRSRAVPPSEAPVHSPVITPPKSRQFKAPQASVDPDYVESVAQGEPRSLSAPAAPPVVAQGATPEPKRGLFNMLRNRNAGVQTAQVQQPQVQQVQVQQQVQPVQAQPAQVRTAPMQIAPVYATPSSSAAAAAYAEYTAPVQTAQVAAPAPAQPRTASRFSFGGSKPGARASNGTPCSELRGIFTSPPECR
jgi:hypothetical protein